MKPTVITIAINKSPLIKTILFYSCVFAAPFLIHLIPTQATLPLAARLLPAFWVVLVLALTQSPFSTLICAALLPTANAFLTARPLGASTPMLTVELLIFAVSVILLKKAWGKKAFLVSTVAYSIAKFSSSMLGMRPYFHSSHKIEGFSFFLSSLPIALPGIVILLFINILILKNLNKEKCEEFTKTLHHHF